MAPHDLDAERATISAALLDQPAMVTSVGLLRPEHFYDKRHQLIFGALTALVSKNMPTIDIVSVAGELRNRGRLSEAGGSAYLAQIVDAVPAVAHVETYAKTVKEKWRIRRLVAVCQRLAAEGYGDVGETQAFLDGAKSAVAEIAEVTPGGAGRPSPVTAPEVVLRWKDEGPLERIPTGVAPLDRMSHGGLPFPWRVQVVGAPSAAKTFLMMEIAHSLSLAEVCVGVHAVDEEPDDDVVRLAQRAGFSIAETERREPETLDRIAAALPSVRFYDATHTMEMVVADVAAWAKETKRPGAVFFDSLQTVRSAGGAAANSPRELVEANVSVMRWAATAHRLLVVATVEANRNSYRTEDAAETTNDLAAGAESRSIEYGAQTQLVLRTPKGHADVVHVRVAKNRRGDRGEFWLRLDRDRHALVECGNPREDPAVAQKVDDAKRAGTRSAVLRDAEIMANTVRRNPGIGERKLRAVLKANGHGWGVERIDAAKHVLGEGVNGERMVNRGTHASQRLVPRNGGAGAMTRVSVSRVSRRVSRVSDTPASTPSVCLSPPYVVGGDTRGRHTGRTEAKAGRSVPGLVQHRPLRSLPGSAGLGVGGNLTNADPAVHAMASEAIAERKLHVEDLSAFGASKPVPLNGGPPAHEAPQQREGRKKERADEFQAWLVGETNERHAHQDDRRHQDKEPPTRRPQSAPSSFVLRYGLSGHAATVPLSRRDRFKCANARRLEGFAPRPIAPQLLAQ
jgi:replicative DNA helicase